MSEKEPGVAVWAMGEMDRLEDVLGEEGLAGRWKVVEVLLGAGDVDGAVDVLRDVMSLARDEAMLEWQVRGYGEIKRIYETDHRFSDLRQDVLWYSKWIAGGMAGFADLSESTIEGLLGEMQKMYEREGESPRPVYGERVDTAMLMGRMGEAEKWFELWEGAAKGESDDCSACEIDRRLEYWIEKGDLKKAMEVGIPLSQDKSGCSNTPATMSRLMAVAMRVGNVELAMHLHGMSCKWVRRSPSMIWAVAPHIMVMTYTGNLEKSRRLVVSGLFQSKPLRNDAQRFRILRASAMWAGLAVVTGMAAAKKSGREVTVPRKCLPGESDDIDGNVGLPEVAAVCLGAAREIAVRLDARNGNGKYVGRVEEAEGAIRAQAERGKDEG